MTTTTGLQIARETVRAFIDSDHWGEDADSVRRIWRAIITMEEDGDEDDKKLAAECFAVAPGLMHWDASGNWIGPMAYENGAAL